MSNKFRITGPMLGEGAYSTVVAGVETSTKNRVAVKMLKKDKLSKLGKSERDAIMKEIKAMQAISHPNVIRLIDYIEDFMNPKTKEACSVVVLELGFFFEHILASGGEFFDFLSYTGNFEEEVARTYFQQLVRGIQAIHKKGFAHRDLKPENLLLDEQFNLKICDFGFARKVDPEGYMKTNLGTRGYMAPEILQRKAYSSKVDIFAAGVILFITLAGFPPFQQANHQDWWFHKLQTGKHSLFWQAHERAARFSREAKDLIVKMLNPNPQQRISLEGVLKHPFFNGKVVEGRELRARLSKRKIQVDNQKRNQHSDFSDVNMSEETAYRSLHHTIGIQGLPERADTERNLEIEQKDLAPVWNDVTACYTKYFTKKSAPGVYKDLLNLVSKTEGSKLVADANSYSLNAKYATSLGDIRVAVNIFSHPQEKGVNVVTFRRRSGSPIGFNKTFAKLYARLKDQSIPEPKKE